jgi:hypothetical protein|nr:MAG: hypothetical protein KatS3mg041_1291 [Bacteroidota bacterium]
MASSQNTIQNLLKIVLAVLIVVLGYLLYRSITDPWREYERQQRMTELVRIRMDNIRTAEREFFRAFGRYTANWDSLIWFLKTDSLLQARLDSLFPRYVGTRFIPDSLPFSPRTGKRFILFVNDTAKVYFLKDPDGPDFIGDSVDGTRVHVASWE